MNDSSASDVGGMVRAHAGVGTLARAREVNELVVEEHRTLSLERCRDDVWLSLDSDAMLVGIGSIATVVTLVEEDWIRALLGKLKHHDRDTYDHSLRVALLSADLACEACLCEEQIIRIAVAALLHDVGKTYIPCALLQKSERLTRREFHIMRTHPNSSFNMLAEKAQNDVRYLVLLHHALQKDCYPLGSEYALRLGLADRDELSIIVACDTYDALTSERPYQVRFVPLVPSDLIERVDGHFMEHAEIDGFLHMVSLRYQYPV